MKNKLSHKIFISATEQSGDNIGKEILKELKKNYPNLIFEGIGGSKMKPFMEKQFYSLKDFKSIGIIEIILSVNKYISIIRRLSNIILNNDYHLIITIDSPDFNYSLSRKVKKSGYKKNIIQIVAPTVWAWRQYRAKKFAEVYDEILTIFSFENKFFNKYKLKTTCIGHPIYYIKDHSKKIKKKNVIAFLPGSRLGEVNSIFKYFDLAYNHLLKINSKYIIFIPTLPHLKDIILNYVKDWKLKTVVSTNNDLIEKYFLKTKVAIVCSGTASLEISKRGIPQLVIYKLNYLTEIILNFLVNVSFANIINIFAKKIIIPELVNSNLKKKIFIKEFNSLLLDDKSNIKQIREVKKFLKKIVFSQPPYKIALNAIKKYL